MEQQWSGIGGKGSKGPLGFLFLALTSALGNISQRGAISDGACADIQAWDEYKSCLEFDPVRGGTGQLGWWRMGALEGLGLHQVGLDLSFSLSSFHFFSLHFFLGHT